MTAAPGVHPVATGVDVVVVETPSLGDRSYLLVSGATAAVIDPQRDVDRIEQVVHDRGLTLSLVLETHVHNDYVSGGLELARRWDAEYVVPGHGLRVERTQPRDGDLLAVGDAVVRAVHTPGHTPDHMSYVVSDGAEPLAVFTGGSMLFGTVGRTDLLGADLADQLTRAQHRSARRLAEELPQATAVLPTHGFGSFCSSAATSGATRSTIADERRTNLALTEPDVDTFVSALLDGLTAYPTYYRHMATLNTSGPAAVDLSPAPGVDAVAIGRRIAAGEWVVDLRSRTAYAHGHLTGTVNLEVGDSFATYLGWTLPWGTPVTLVSNEAADVAEAQRQMVRIGIDRPAGAASGGVESWADGGELTSYLSVKFPELARARTEPGVVILDVRRDDEWAAGHIDGATHIPLHDLEARVDEVPPGTVWVHCGSGYRAAVAASLLDRAGRSVVAVDDDWDAAARCPDLPLSGRADRR